MQYFRQEESIAKTDFLGKIMDMILKPLQIKALRDRLNWSPTKMAAEVGVTASIISRWEAGKASPRVKNMERLNELAREKGIDVETLGVPDAVSVPLPDQAPPQAVGA